ncbi:hypothetical protein WJX84_005196 [Apatococcus fuscideae]|uniref:Uncharacterized protein n=1 Tax=Apatococcus fuscideae TaxID=2026836 RepID=A0AAW1TEU1_9CHLO
MSEAPQKSLRPPRRSTCNLLRWYLSEDGIVTEENDPVDVFEGDIVDCPKGKDGAHSVESLTTDIAVLVANKEVVFDEMVIALFNDKGLGKENYTETISGAILEERVQAAGMC